MESCLFVRLMGRTGNQFFQVAVGIAQAAEHGKKLVLVLNDGDVLSPWIHGIPVVNALPAETPCHYEGATFPYHVIPSPACDFSLYGYFQSLQYFSAHWEAVKAAIRHPSPESVTRFVKGVQASFPIDSDFVGVHFRFGDYLHQPQNFPIPTSKYYETALSRMPPDAVVFVYSDNLPMSRVYTSTWERTIHEISYNEVDTLEFISQLCNYHITANSSYSWWASRLSGCPPENICMPSPWFGPGPDVPKEHSIYVPGCTVIDYVAGESFTHINTL